MPPTQAVLHQLADYSGKDLDEIKFIVSHTNGISKKTWSAAECSTPESLHAFHVSISNWIFGSMSYHARQAEGLDWPRPALPVQVADALKHLKPGHHLDFGSGVGTASLLFESFGWDVSLADVSIPLLDFARWRFAQSNIPAEFIDLNTSNVREENYDLITAFNTMVHVPDVRQTISDLRSALKPGGLLVFDIEARRPAPGNEWFLYQHHYQVLRRVRTLGFARADRIGAMHVYRRTERGQIGTCLVAVADFVRFNAVTTMLGSLGRPARSATRTLRGVLSNRLIRGIGRPARPASR